MNETTASLRQRNPEHLRSAKNIRAFLFIIQIKSIVAPLQLSLHTHTRQFFGNLEREIDIYSYDKYIPYRNTVVIFSI